MQSTVSTFKAARFLLFALGKMELMIFGLQATAAVLQSFISQNA